MGRVVVTGPAKHKGGEVVVHFTVFVGRRLLLLLAGKLYISFLLDSLTR
jgi:hypothetical protein